MVFWMPEKESGWTGKNMKSQKQKEAPDCELSEHKKALPDASDGSRKGIFSYCGNNKHNRDFLNGC